MATKSETAKSETRPPRVQQLVDLAELALKFRNGEAGKLTMSEVVRMTGRAARLLRFTDKDERSSVENAATMQIARAHNLIS